MFDVSLYMYGIMSLELFWNSVHSLRYCVAHISKTNWTKLAKTLQECSPGVLFVVLGKKCRVFSPWNNFLIKKPIVHAFMYHVKTYVLYEPESHNFTRMFTSLWGCTPGIAFLVSSNLCRTELLITFIISNEACKNIKNIQNTSN